jgi:hypothetical protein
MLREWDKSRTDQLLIQEAPQAPIPVDSPAVPAPAAAN